MLERTYTHDITPGMDGEEVAVAGWAHEIRDLGGLTFVILRDREGTLQLTFKEDRHEELFQDAQEIGKEDVIWVKGTVEKNEQAPGDRELKPIEMEIIGHAESPLPMDVSKNIDSDLATRLDSRFMDLRRAEIHAVFSLKSHLVEAMEEWFDRENYIRIQTPLISKEGAEGGAELFPIIYYEQEAFLSQSPQLYKQMLMAAGFDKVYETGVAFRAEDFATSRHVSEIQMFDVELAFIEDHHDVMDVQEESLRYALEELGKRAADDLDILDAEIEVPEGDFPRITFDEAREILKEEYGHVPEDENDLDTKGEKLLGEYFEQKGHPAFFVVGYPDQHFYYMQDVLGDDIASRKFDLIYRGLELSSGGQRQHDLGKIEEYMEKQDADPENFSFYLEAFKFGMPPHGGYGLGIDRLVKQIAGLDNIQEAILFPRTPERLTP